MKNHLQFKKMAVTAVILLFCLSFAQAFALNPTITSFSPESGAVGTLVTITGENFNTTAANNVVFFGAIRATISSADATTLTVTVPVGATCQNISVTDITTGLTAYSSRPFITTFDGGTVFNPNSFADKVDSATGISSMCVLTGDLDEDGKSDVIVVNYSNHNFSVFKNTSVAGSVSFATKEDFATELNPYYAAIGDLDGDGKLDLAVTNYSSNSVSVYKNMSTSGSITFADKIDYATGTNPQHISIADLDNDGKPDLVVANYNAGNVSVFRNTSTPISLSFAAKADYTTGDNPNSIAISDLDGDGLSDMVVGNFSNSFSVFENTSTAGTISFATKVDYTTPENLQSANISDFDGDGKPDLVLANSGKNKVSIYRNTSTAGSISLMANVEYAAENGTYDISINDLDGDGMPDLAAINLYETIVSVFKNTSTSGSISFATKVNFETGIYPVSIVSGDIDGDGKPDLIVDNAHTFSVLRSRVMPPPTISSFTPTSAGTGDTVTISGTYLSEPLAADFGGTDASSLTGVSPTVMKAVVGDGATGDVSVITPGGTATLTGFKYLLSQAISFVAISEHTYGDSDFSLNATASSSLPVTFSSSDNSVATVISDVVHITGAGTCNIYADQGGDDNYHSAPRDTQRLVIKTKSLTITDVTAGNKVYDGTVTATLTGGSLSGIINSDDVTFTDGSGEFTDKNAGTGKAVTAKGYSLAGADMGNYSLSEQPTGLTADITPAPLTITGVTAENKVYDGTTSATLTGGSLSGIINPDDVTLTEGTVEFTDKDVGTGKTVTATGYSIAGADVGNYSLTEQPTGLTADITPAPLTITGIVVDNKVYDGTTLAILTGGSLSGVVNSEDVTLTEGTGEFTDKNAGTGKTVTATGYSIAGADEGNYSLSEQPTGLSADITPAPLTITGITADNKVYDGTTSATLTGGSLSGIINSDDVTLTDGSGEFADKNAGTSKTITVTGYSIAGTDVGNYSLSEQPTGLTANITPAPLTITTDPGQSKEVGADDPELTYTITEGNLIEGDALTGSLTREAGETAGTYATQIGSLSAGDNYTITFISAGFTINSVSAISEVSVIIPHLYPNATNGLVNLKASDGQVTVIDAVGEIIVQRAINKDNTIDLRGYASGVYILILKTGDSVYKYLIMKQ